jgi:hypothetical protein
MDTTVPPGSYISPADNHKTFNSSWGGYTGIHEYQLVEMTNLDTRSIDDWRTNQVRYALITRGEFDKLSQSPDKHLLQETLLLKKFAPSGNYRGPTGTVALRLYPPQHTFQGSLGSIALIGYDLDKTTALPGDVLHLTLYWRAASATDGAYQVFNHLVSADNKLVAQADGTPLFDARRSTSTWTDPEETFISQQFSIPVPADTPDGQYKLLTGFYRADTGARLTGAAGQDSLTIETIILGEGEPLEF